MSEAARIVKSYVDRIEAVEVEQREVADVKRSIYDEAKGRGYNAKALRKLVAERKRKVDEQTEHDLDVYRLALEQAINEAASGKISQRAAAKKFGVSKSAVNRGVPRAEKLDEGHDAATGELHEPPASEAAGTGVEQAPGVEGQLVASNPVGSSTPSIQPNKENDHGHRDFRDGSGSGAPQVQSERQGRGVGDQAVDGVAGDDAGTDRPAQRQDGDRGRDSGDPACADGQHVGGLRGDEGIVDTSAGTVAPSGSAPVDDTRSFSEIAGPLPEHLRRATA